MALPNLALIVLDALRYDHVGMSVGGRALCPYLSDFAERAVFFEHAISPAGYTGPTHASFMTGQLPSQHGMFSWRQFVSGALPAPSLTAMLRRAGYICLGFSANPFVALNTAMGRDFDVLIESDRLWRPGSAPRPGFLERQARRLKRLAGLRGRRAARTELPLERRRALTCAERLVNAADITLRAVRAQWPGRPVFVFMNLMATHAPYLFEPQDADFTRPADMTADRLPLCDVPDAFWLDLLGIRPIDEAGRARIRWAYAASVRYADRLAGRVLGVLDELLGAGTDVVVTADHGELLGEHGFYDHGAFLYEPLVHVPLIVRSADAGDGGRLQRMVQTHWLWSLMMERAGLLDEVEVPAGQGSLSPHAGGSGGAMYSFSDPSAGLTRLRIALRAAAETGADARKVNPRALDPHVQAVRLNDRVLIRTASGRRLAFDVSNGTERQLSGEQFDETCRLLEPQFLEVAAPVLPAPDEKASPDAGVISRLRNLGYAD